MTCPAHQPRRTRPDVASALGADLYFISPNRRYLVSSFETVLGEGKGFSHPHGNFLILSSVIYNYIVRLRNRFDSWLPCDS